MTIKLTNRESITTLRLEDTATLYQFLRSRDINQILNDIVNSAILSEDIEGSFEICFQLEPATNDTDENREGDDFNIDDRGCPGQSLHFDAGVSDAWLTLR